MFRLDAIRDDLRLAKFDPAEVAWLVDTVDEAVTVLREAKSILIGEEVAGAAKMFPNAVRVKHRIEIVLARLEASDA